MTVKRMHVFRVAADLGEPDFLVRAQESRGARIYTLQGFGGENRELFLRLLGRVARAWPSGAIDVEVDDNGHRIVGLPEA